MDSLSFEMQRFLISTVFGYDMNSEDENYNQLKNSCFARAYLDLARVIPYCFSTSHCDGHKNDLDVKLFIEKKRKFKDGVKGIIFDEKHIDPVDSIQEIYDYANMQENLFKQDDEFSFGMAQKWVNMFNKYMWLFGKNREKTFDMPIDSYIIDALYEKHIIDLDFCIENKLSEEIWDGMCKGNKRPSDYITPWSKWNRQKYSAVQNRISSMLSVRNILEWENEQWLSQLMKHNSYNTRN